MGNPLPAARSIFENVTNRATQSGKVGNALSRDLFSTDPILQKDFLDRLIARRAIESQRLQNAGRNTGLLSGILGQQVGRMTEGN
jgi:hypothetical protein